MSDRSKRNATRRRRTDGGRVKFLIMLPADAIKAVKMRAIDQGKTASELLEKAVAAWIKANRNVPPRRPEKTAAAKKRQFLSQMDAKLVKQIKVMAIDCKTTASTLVGRAVAEWLEKGADYADPVA